MEMMTDGTFLSLFALYACFGFGAFIYALVRFIKNASGTWVTIAKGIVADIRLNEVPRTPYPADNGQMAPTYAETVITFDHGKRLRLLGNFATECKVGDTIQVDRNKLGDYRVEHIVN